jgi:hypothetical protein
MTLILSQGTGLLRFMYMCINIAILFAVILFNSSSVQSADEFGEVEYKLKAAFMLNFAKFIKWPGKTRTHDIFKICIYGQSPFLNAFSGTEKKTIGGNPVDIVMAENLSDIKGCRLVFISRSEEADLQKIFKEIDGEPIVSVSDIRAFAKAGGTMEFVSRNNKLGFIVNNTKAKKNGLTINASLLGLAVEVL